MKLLSWIFSLYERVSEWLIGLLDQLLDNMNIKPIPTDGPKTEGPLAVACNTVNDKAVDLSNVWHSKDGGDPYHVIVLDDSTEEWKVQDVATTTIITVNAAVFQSNYAKVQ